MRTGAAWHFPTQGNTSVVADIVAAEVAVPDPETYARRWAALLDISYRTTTLNLHGRRLRFVPRTQGRDGLVAVELAASSGASAHADHVLCGVDFRVVPA